VPPEQGAHALPHISADELHSMPQLVPSQVAVPLGSPGQGVQLVPHVCTRVSATQAPLQSWVPLVQAMPQLVPSQVAVPLGSPGHGSQRAQHVRGSLPETHCPEQRWIRVSDSHM